MDSSQGPLVTRDYRCCGKWQKGPPCCSGGRPRWARQIPAVPQTPHGLGPEGQGQQGSSSQQSPFGPGRGPALAHWGHLGDQGPLRPPTPSPLLPAFSVRMDPCFWSFLKTVDTFPVETMTFSVSHYALHNAPGRRGEKENKAWEPAPLSVNSQAACLCHRPRCLSWSHLSGLTARPVFSSSG